MDDDTRLEQALGLLEEEAFDPDLNGESNLCTLCQVSVGEFGTEASYDDHGEDCVIRLLHDLVISRR